MMVIFKAPDYRSHPAVATSAVLLSGNHLWPEFKLCYKLSVENNSTTTSPETYTTPTTEANTTPSTETYTTPSVGGIDTG